VVETTPVVEVTPDFVTEEAPAYIEPAVSEEAAETTEVAPEAATEVAPEEPSSFFQLDLRLKDGSHRVVEEMMPQLDELKAEKVSEAAEPVINEVPVAEEAPVAEAPVAEEAPAPKPKRTYKKRTPKVAPEEGTVAAETPAATETAPATEVPAEEAPKPKRTYRKRTPKVDNSEETQITLDIANADSNTENQ
jgi:hypothetical protein